MKIYLIRHGETDWNLQGRLQGREDIQLNENGVNQAIRCAQAFTNRNIKAVVTSPLSRASKTAQIIFDNISLVASHKVSTHEGCLDDASPEDVSSEDVSPDDVCSGDVSPENACPEDTGPENACPEALIVEDALIERDFGPMSGLSYDKRKHFDTFGISDALEPLEAVSKRLLECIYGYAKLYQNKDIIMVSHGGAINAVLATLSQGELGTGKTRLKNACINILSYDSVNDAIKIEDYNLTAEEFEEKV